MKEVGQTFMEGSKASRGTSGTQALRRPEVLLKPQTPFTLECFFSEPEAGLTAHIRNSSMNIHDLFLFLLSFWSFSFIYFYQDFKKPQLLK